VKPGIYFGITQESYILLADDEETIHFGSIWFAVQYLGMLFC
jgi:hypothetical protein